MEYVSGVYCPQCGKTVQVKRELWIAHTRHLACWCQICSVWWDVAISGEEKILEVNYIGEES